MPPASYFFDSSFIIAARRSRRPSLLADRFRELVELGQAAINEVVRYEILVGCRNDEETRIADEVLSALDLLPIDRSAWDQAVDLSSRLRRLGLARPLADIVIAATTIRHSATLLHLDADFETIAQHSDLKTESYLDAI